MLVTVFVACDNGKTPDDKETNESTGGDETTGGSNGDVDDDTTAGETTGGYVDPIVDESFNNTEVNMLVRQNRYYYLWMPDGNSTDTVERAVFARNDEIEVRFDVEFAIEQCESSASLYKTQITNQTPSYYYDIVSWDYFWALEQNGQFSDIQAMNEINTDDYWWHDGWNKNVTVNGKQFSISGDAALEVLQNLEVIFYHKQIAEQYQLELYDLVEDGKWDIAEMKAICEQVANNLDDDNTENDFWGALYDVHSMGSGLYSAGIKYVNVAADGSISIPNDSATKTRLVDICDAFTALIKSPSVNYSSATARARDYSLFKEQNALFFASCLYIGKDMKALGLPFDYGILPAPKYDDDAPYISTAYGVTIFSIPTACQNQHRAATILNAMNALANIAVEDGIVWTFYEQVIKGRVADAPADARMIDLAKEGLYFDFAFVNEGLLTLHAAGKSAVTTGTSLNSTLNVNIKSAKQNLTALLAVYQ
jgi:hypothetical protein